MILLYTLFINFSLVFLQQEQHKNFFVTKHRIFCPNWHVLKMRWTNRMKNGVTRGQSLTSKVSLRNNRKRYFFFISFSNTKQFFFCFKNVLIWLCSHTNLDNFWYRVASHIKQKFFFLNSAISFLFTDEMDYLLGKRTKTCFTQTCYHWYRYEGA